MEFPVKVIKQIFTNEDEKVGVLYLISSETTLSFDLITTIYQRRSNVEVYHKSLQQHVSLAKSPTHTEKMQTNHFFAAFCGHIKLEMLKVETKTNHFAMKTKLYVNALHSAFQILREFNFVQYLRVR